MFVFEVFPPEDVLLLPIPKEPNITPIPVLSSELDVFVNAILKSISCTMCSLVYIAPIFKDDISWIDCAVCIF